MSRPGRALLAYDAAAADSDAASRDVFVQLDAIEAALAVAGPATERVAVGLDFARLKAVVAGDPQALVFNLVESLDGVDRLQTLFPMLLESWGTPFTGSGSQAMYLSNHKVLSKTVLAGAGVPFPACCFLDASGRSAFLPEADGVEGRWIFKPLEAHASLFMDDAAVGEFADAARLGDRLRELKARHGVDFFAERFIDGREFNLSLVEDGEGIRVLPPSEIVFVDFPAGKPRIVGYAAKWDETSEEYRNTPRVSGTLADGPDLAAELARLARASWDAFGLSGYGRVDFRVDAAGRPFVLEANANPCLSPDAGLALAAAEAGWSYAELCARIIEAAVQRRPLSAKV